MMRLVKTGVEGGEPCTDAMEISRPGNLGDIASLGVTLAEAKQLPARAQQEIVAAQVRKRAVRRPDCSRCGGCRVKDCRDHAVATLGSSTSDLEYCRVHGQARHNHPQRPAPPLSRFWSQI